MTNDLSPRILPLYVALTKNGYSATRAEVRDLMARDLSLTDKEADNLIDRSIRAYIIRENAGILSIKGKKNE